MNWYSIPKHFCLWRVMDWQLITWHFFCWDGRSTRGKTQSLLGFAALLMTMTKKRLHRYICSGIVRMRIDFNREKVWEMQFSLSRSMCHPTKHFAFKSGEQSHPSQWLTVLTTTLELIYQRTWTTQPTSLLHNHMSILVITQMPNQSNSGETTTPTSHIHIHGSIREITSIFAKPL